MNFTYFPLGTISAKVVIPQSPYPTENVADLAMNLQNRFLVLYWESVSVWAREFPWGFGIGDRGNLRCRLIKRLAGISRHPGIFTQGEFATPIRWVGALLWLSNKKGSLGCLFVR